jgi:hypothetical protein
VSTCYIAAALETGNWFDNVPIANAIGSTVCRILRDTGTARPSWVEASELTGNVVWVGHASERFTVELLDRRVGRSSLRGYTGGAFS